MNIFKVMCILLKKLDIYNLLCLVQKKLLPHLAPADRLALLITYTSNLTRSKTLKSRSSQTKCRDSTWPNWQIRCGKAQPWFVLIFLSNYANKELFSFALLNLDFCYYWQTLSRSTKSKSKYRLTTGFSLKSDSPTTQPPSHPASHPATPGKVSKKLDRAMFPK